MELSDAIASRRSIRKFKDQGISEETIRELLEAARLAPSGSNIQPSRFVIVQSPAAKEAIGGCTPYKFITKAAVIFVCCADLGAQDSRNRRIMELVNEGAFEGIDIDMNDPAATTTSVVGEAAIKASLSMNVAIAVEHIALKAVDLGLGSCWLGRFDRDKVKTYLDLEDHILPVMLLPVGYPDQSPKPRPRFELDKLIIKTI